MASNNDQDLSKESMDIDDLSLEASMEDSAEKTGKVVETSDKVETENDIENALLNDSSDGESTFLGFKLDFDSPEKPKINTESNKECKTVEDLKTIESKTVDDLKTLESKTDESVETVDDLKTLESKTDESVETVDDLKTLESKTDESLETVDDLKTLESKTDEIVKTVDLKTLESKTDEILKAVDDLKTLESKPDEILETVDDPKTSEDQIESKLKESSIKERLETDDSSRDDKGKEERSGVEKCLSIEKTVEEEFRIDDRSPERIPEKESTRNEKLDTVEEKQLLSDSSVIEGETSASISNVTEYFSKIEDELLKSNDFDRIINEFSSSLSKGDAVSEVSSRIDNISNEFDDDDTSFSGSNSAVQKIIASKFADIEQTISDITADLGSDGNKNVQSDEEDGESSTSEAKEDSNDNMSTEEVLKDNSKEKAEVDEDISGDDGSKDGVQTEKEGGEHGKSKKSSALAEIKAKNDQQMVDLEDASMDGAHETDALGLLAEAEGRERHSSDPDDDDEEDDDVTSERDSMESHNYASEREESADDPDEMTEPSDEDYDPIAEDDLDEDDDIDEEDEDGLNFRGNFRGTSRGGQKRRRSVVDPPPDMRTENEYSMQIEEETSQGNAELQNNSELNEDTANQDLLPNDDMELDDTVGQNILSICNVTSLSVDQNGVEQSLEEAENDLERNDEEEAENDLERNDEEEAENDLERNDEEEAENDLERNDEEEAEANLVITSFGTADEEILKKLNETVDDKAEIGKKSDEIDSNDAEVTTPTATDEQINVGASEGVVESPKDKTDTETSADDTADLMNVSQEEEIQNLWDSIMEGDSNKEISNKRKADDSLEKARKKLDTKQVSEEVDDDVLTFARDHGKVFPAVEDAQDHSDKPDDLSTTLDRLTQVLEKSPESPVPEESVEKTVQPDKVLLIKEEKDADAYVETPSKDLYMSIGLTVKVEKPDEAQPVATVDTACQPAAPSSMDLDIPAEVNIKVEPAPSEKKTVETEPSQAVETEPVPDVKETAIPADTVPVVAVAEPSLEPALVPEKPVESSEPPEKLDVAVPSEKPLPKSEKPIADVVTTPAASKIDEVVTKLATKPVSEVFSLDSDDEDEAAKASPVQVSQQEAIKKLDDPSPTKKDLSPRSRDQVAVKGDRGKCVNPACVSAAAPHPCPLFLPSLYRARDLTKAPLACKECLDRGVALMELLTSRLRAGVCLFTVDMPNTGELVEISDSDSENESDPSGGRRVKKGATRKWGGPTLPKEEQQFLLDNLEEVFASTWSRHRVHDQLRLCEDKLHAQVDALQAESRELGKLIDAEQTALDVMRKTLYETFKPVTECRTELIISDNGDKQIEVNLMVERRSARISKKQAQYLDEDMFKDQPLPTADSVEVDDPNAVTEVNPETLPPEGLLPEQPLQVGDTVYAVKQSIFGAWCPAKIVQVLPKGTPLANGTLSLFSLVRVRFVQGAEGGRAAKQVTGRQVAYPEPADVRYPIGTRIIALFKDKKQLKEAYYSGVIAEVPIKTNFYRYLVFFDDGYARYVSHKSALLVCERSLRVWEDVHPDSRDFVRKYLQGFPNQPMVRVQLGHSIRAEYNGKFWFAHVMSVDASLALIRFSEVSGAPITREEWIYRGSTRLEPLFLELQAADRRAHGRHRATYATTHPAKNKNFPYVEYSRPDQPEDQQQQQTDEKENQEATKVEEENVQQAAVSRAVAKKSTSVPAPAPPVKEDPPRAKEREQQPPAQQLHADQVKSKVVYYSPKVSIKPKKMVPHTCGSDCLNRVAIPLRELRTYNPLARPLLSGWQRLILKYRGKRSIMYLSPCGRRLRSSQELHLYLRLTHSQMSVDLFDFDHWVHCLAEFVPTKCFVSKKDLSHGVEAVPVPCVNYYDHTLPEFSAYSTRRIPTQGVHLNLDEEFLCGCDCTDDCQDRNKCQCWQLTLEGAELVGCQRDRVGYQYKRLLEPVPTGIYECNSRCKCAATCLNRVVQHPLQLKLQVFKTFNRGWGIRALNDVSRGTFLCIYAGNLLTDAVANVDGVTEGDEYLAELDYIEVVEKLKENYESDVPEEDKDFDEKSDGSDGEGKAAPMHRDGKTGAHGESDEEFQPTTYIPKGKPSDSDDTRMTTRRQLRKKRGEKDGDKEKEKEKEMERREKERKEEKEKEQEKKEKERREERQSKDSDCIEGVAPVVDEFITISDDEENMREPSRFAAPEGLNDDEYVPKHRSVRGFFGKDEACYIMDAKVQGNLGRYLNHSCSPNVFVQNVFVDTHDPRFPWVAFFTLQHVRAGTELTWNYNYDVGSVPDKTLYCRCGASNCRGRLL